MRRISVLMVLVSSLLFVASVEAGTATVTGTITHAAGQKKPAINVAVIIASKVSYTDVKGRYRIKDVPFGRQLLTLKKNGKVLKEVSLNVGKSQVVHDDTIP